MTEADRTSRLGKALTRIGYLWFALIFLSPLFLSSLVADALGATFFPALGLIFAGRVVTRRAKRRSMDDVVEASQPVESPRPTPRPTRPQPPRRDPVRTPQPKTDTPDPAQVEADLEKALAAYRVEPETVVPDVAEPIVAEPGDVEPGELAPKTSAEMIEEVHRRWRKES